MLILKDNEVNILDINHDAFYILFLYILDYLQIADSMLINIKL